ncbi:hypothetical protein D9756_002060 [Leucocoprinus leucothites]|uniref:F-box domain-containing protein n=1 Tax=Leucocoprinus leucothites TaxID=201217 RepID=A0A8H5LM35_9AGAR|nr:hypothetical protein D9756_002060 [Leucoagaricus leucothites]
MPLAHFTPHQAHERRFSSPRDSWRNLSVSSLAFQRWRSIAISFPPLWCYIQICLPALYPPIQQLSLWIDRSRNNSLSLNVGYPCLVEVANPRAPFTQDTQQYFKAVLKVLTPTCNRWASLKLEFDLGHATIFQRYVFQQATKLHKLDVSVWGMRDELFDEEAFLTALSTTPTLKRLKLCMGLYERPAQLTPDFPWHSLAHVDLSCDIPWECLACTLSSCTSVVYLSICAIDRANDEKAVPKHIFLPNLRRLRIGLSSNDAFTLFDLLECPQLCVLNARIGRPRHGVHHQAYGHLESFLRGNRHDIHGLTLELWLNQELHAADLDLFLSLRRAQIVYVEITIYETGIYDCTSDFNELIAVLDDVSLAGGSRSSSFPPLVVLEEWTYRETKPGRSDGPPPTNFFRGLRIPYCPLDQPHRKLCSMHVD